MLQTNIYIYLSLKKSVSKELTHMEVGAGSYHGDTKWITDGNTSPLLPWQHKDALFLTDHSWSSR